VSDLTNLASFCRIKAANDHEPPGERELWTQMADEIDGYLFPDEVEAEAGLFDHEATQVQVHHFHEDVNDASMCICGIPAVTHADTELDQP
jgi:hypothetical protein